VIYLVGGASIFLILFGIRGSASIINPILLAAVITITVLPIPSRLTRRGVPGWLALVLSILMVVVFVGLFIWGYLLGGIGAILTVPMTLLVLITMENFEGTRPLAILMRYTGEQKEGERQEALESVKGRPGELNLPQVPQPAGGSIYGMYSFCPA
jgi:predicted PurR-regulated permease PerM